MRRALLLVLVACAGPSKKSNTVDETAPPERKEVPQDRQPDPLPPPAVDAKPDVPSGAAAKRDAELAERAAGYFDAFVSNDPAWTPDGKRVVFASNRDGLPQLYIADATKPTSPATRLFTTKERLGDPFVTRDGKALLFVSDVGADELWSIYRSNIDGSGVVDLTPGERLNRDGFLVPEKLPGTMFFSARKMSEPKSTL